MNREEVESLAHDYIKSFDRLLLLLPTGHGKSKVSISTCFKYLKNRKKYKILLLVAETSHKKNWRGEFKKWNYPLDNVTIVCYASLHKYVNTQWDVIIADECHRVLSDIRLNALKSIRYKKLILASATLSSKDIDSLNTLGNIGKIEVSLDTAIDKGTLPEPTINIVKLTLDDSIVGYTYIYRASKMKTVNILYKQKKAYMFNPAYKDYKLKVKCTAKEYYNLLTDEVNWKKDIYDKHKTIVARDNWLRAANKRKKWLGNHKTYALYELIRSLGNKRHICFCNSIEQAEYVNEENSIHSKRNKPLLILDKYNNKEINSIYAIKMLREGVNLVDTQYGIIVQLDNKELPTVQMIGRLLRHPNPVVYVMYIEGTRDEEYFKNTILNIIDSKYLNFIELDIDVGLLNI